MDLDDSQKLTLYMIISVMFMFMTACFAQMCILPGSKCNIPGLTKPAVEKSYVYTETPKYTLKQEVDYQARLETEYGFVHIDLFEKAAPVTVNNFVFLAMEGYYDGVKFHRIFRDVLMQTGDRNTLDSDISNDGFGGPGYQFPNEVNWDSIGLTDDQKSNLTVLGFSTKEGIVSEPMKKYAVAMANDGSEGTNGSQFFIVTMDAKDTRLQSLNGKYTVFGQVIDGHEVVDKLNEVDVNLDDPNLPYPLKDVIVDFVDIYEITPGSGVKVNGSSSSNRTKDQTVVVE